MPVEYFQQRTINKLPSHSYSLFRPSLFLYIYFTSNYCICGCENVFVLSDPRTIARTYFLSLIIQTLFCGTPSGIFLNSPHSLFLTFATTHCPLLIIPYKGWRVAELHTYIQVGYQPLRRMGRTGRHGNLHHI